MNNSNLFHCYCQARKAQAFYSRCLDENSYSQEEKELLYEIVKKASETSNRIKDFCSKY